MALEAFSNGWKPRPYQEDVRAKFAAGINRHILIWHRRAGKDTFGLNIADELRRTRVGTYWHLFPFHVQAKKAIWYGIDKTGERFIDQAFPKDERKATRINDLQIEFENGSIWQMAGSDKYDSLVGANPVGVFFSEWALCDPRAWDYIRPIIRENDGFACFITTYRGRNHAHRMAKRLAENADWNVDIRTVDDTTDIHGERILTQADIDAERADGMSEALIQQEYYCNPLAAVEGAVYGRAFEQLMSDQRVGTVTYDPGLPVVASWSLEFDDQYTVVFAQQRGNESRIIASDSIQFASVSEALDKIAGAYPWRRIARHIVPPKTSSEALGLFEQRAEIVEPAPALPAVQMLTRERLGLTRIDNQVRPWTDNEPNNELLVDALNGYHYPKTAQGGFAVKPANTWEKHYSRALEVLSLAQHYDPESAGGWHPPPDMTQRDRAVI